MSDDKDTDMTALRLAALRNPSVQPARRRRNLSQAPETAEQEPPMQEVSETTETEQDPKIASDQREDESAHEAEGEAEEKSSACEPANIQASAGPKDEAAQGDTADTPQAPDAIIPNQSAPGVDPAKAALSLTNIIKTYGQGNQRVEVLRQASLIIGKGQIVGLIGPSGSGKSTLLQIAGLLDSPTSGAIQIRGMVADDLNDRQRTLLRRDTVGFVYQFHHLLKEFSAIENVMMPQRIAGVPDRQARERAKDLLTRVGLAERMTHRPAKLSGGEQQRVAIARALANRPALLLADEPTGNLDPQTAESVFQMLLSLTREEGMAALIATHNLELGARMDRRVRLDHGQVHEH